jgi:hypothetical protein
MAPMEFKPDQIDQIMAEADDLIRQIYSEKIDGMEEAQRVEYEKKVKRLEELKAIVREKTKEQPAGSSSVSSGIHEAIDELVQAVNDTAKRLT